MSEARIRVFEGSEITFNKRIDCTGDTGATLTDPFGNGHDYFVEHQTQKSGNVVLFELSGDLEPKAILDFYPEERTELFDSSGDSKRFVRITHQGERKDIKLLRERVKRERPQSKKAKN